MYANADNIQIPDRCKSDRDGLCFKSKNDPRITRLGKFIRKYSIDELPQLFNVLKGDMSLVGPRPAISQEAIEYNRYEKKRLKVMPGITCYWQVKGRADLSFQQQVQLDIDYIKEHSIWTDLKILLQTVPAVLLAKGAY